jgi:hypothetical protein
MHKENVASIYHIAYINTMQFYSSIKNKTMSFAGKWMELQSIMLSKISQTEKYYLIYGN